MRREGNDGSVFTIAQPLSRVERKLRHMSDMYSSRRCYFRDAHWEWAFHVAAAGSQSGPDSCQLDARADPA
jgi:hypothetical protein